MYKEKQSFTSHQPVNQTEAELSMKEEWNSGIKYFFNENQGKGCPCLGGKKTKNMFLFGNKRPNSVVSKMTNMTLDSRTFQKLKKQKALSVGHCYTATVNHSTHDYDYTA